MCTIITDTLRASLPQFKWMYMWVHRIILPASPDYLYYLSGSVKHNTLRSFSWLPYIYYVSLLMCSLNPLCYFCCQKFYRENGRSRNLFSMLPLTPFPSSTLRTIVVRLMHTPCKKLEGSFPHRLTKPRKKDPKRLTEWLKGFEWSSPAR